MKKIIAVLAVMAMTMVCVTAAFAEITIGAKSDFVLGQRFDLKNLNTKVDYVGQNYNIVADIELGPLTISPSAGISRCSFETANVKVNSGNGWNAGISARVTYPVLDLFDVSATGSYSITRNDMDKIVIGGTSITNPIETILYLHEYEFGLLASKDFAVEVGDINAKITPYGGVVYSDVNGIVETGGAIGFEEEISARQNWGARYGVRVQATDCISVAINAAAIDKIAVGGSVLIKF